MTTDGNALFPASTRQCALEVLGDTDIWTGGDWQRAAITLASAVVAVAGDLHKLPSDDLTVLGRCIHGVDLDRDFCPKGCRV